MSLTVSSATSALIASITGAATTQQDIQTATLKKALDNQQLQGEDALQLIQASAPPPQTGLDVYA
jgi:Putative motility protein